jgi:two-component system LytT family response regulator
MSVECVDDSRLLSSIEEGEPDLVILDINSPVVRGAKSWEALGIKSPPATIVTSYDPASLSAFASAATASVIKPFDVERFEAAVELAKSTIVRALEPGADERSSESERGARRRQFLQRLAVEAGEKIVLVRIADIAWLHSSGNHTQLYVGKTSYLVRRSMKNLQAVLDPARFLRVHRSAIVNLDHVVEFHLPPNGNMFVKLDDGLCVPLRKGNRALLRKLLKNIS